MPAPPPRLIDTLHQVAHVFRDLSERRRLHFANLQAGSVHEAEHRSTNDTVHACVEFRRVGGVRGEELTTGSPWSLGVATSNDERSS